MTNTQLIQETTDNLKEFLPKISGSCMMIADLLRKDKESEAFELINQFADAMAWSIRAINGIQSLAQPLNIDTSEANEYLIEAHEGLSLNDHILIADMFEYEVHSVIEGWITEIRGFNVQ